MLHVAIPLWFVSRPWRERRRQARIMRQVYPPQRPPVPPMEPPGRSDIFMARASLVFGAVVMLWMEFGTQLHWG